MSLKTTVSSSNNPAYQANNKAIESFIRLFRSPILMRLILWVKLPAAAFMGLKLSSLTPDKAITSIKYSWRTKNPFKSTYFAAQAAAAEFSTGILAQVALQGQEKVTMLVAGMEAKYIKKGTGKLFFECTQGEAIRKTIAKAQATGEGEKLILDSKGYSIEKDGTKVLISTFHFTWWFKAKQ